MCDVVMYKFDNLKQVFILCPTVKTAVKTKNKCCLSNLQLKTVDIFIHFQY